MGGDREMASMPMTEAMYYILLAVTRPCHGYAMMGRIHDLSGGRLEMGPGTLYGVLTRMKKDGWIDLREDDGRRKIYEITALGRELLLEEHCRLQRLVTDGIAVLEGGDAE